MGNNAPRQEGAGKNCATSESRARQALIAGNPPRIRPLKPDELTKDASEVNDKIRQAVSLPATGEIPDFTATMLRHPDLYRHHAALSLELFRGALVPRDRELAILRVGWLCQSPTEWGEHVRLGKQLGGLTDEEVARVTVGSAADGWNERDRALLKAVEELHSDAMISETTWNALSRSLDRKQLIELPVLVGQYQGISYLHNSLRIRLTAGNEGLLAR